MPKSIGTAYDVLSIKVSDRLMDQLAEVCQEDPSVTESLYSEIGLMAESLIKNRISRYIEKKTAEDNLDLFSR